MGCCLCVPKNNTCRYPFNITEERQSIKNKLVEEFKSDILIPDAPIVNTSLNHSEKILIG